jgi:hypothetical protein
MSFIFRLNIHLLLIMVCFVMLSSQSFAQNDKKVRVSPKAAVIQTVGFTEIRIDYNRPGVKGRVIWNGLVPYNKVWRTGANEATKFTFSTDVQINGKTLKAGSYSFFAIPTNENWTLIFNKVADQWGAFEYNEAEDALRFEIAPEEGSMQEWLAYTITKTSKNSAVVTLEWEKLKVPFTIEVSIN